MADPKYLLVKRGLFYAPNNQGYTGIKANAGRYHESDARPHDGVTAVHEDEAPLFSPACWNEGKVDWLLGQIAVRDAVIAAQGGPWIFPKSIDDMPAKPGKASYEYVECLVLRRGELMSRPWNCGHLCFDDEDQDDHFCDWDDIEAYQVLPTIAAIRAAQPANGDATA